MAKKGSRPEAALGLGRKRPRRAYTGVNPHRNKILLRCNNCKQVSAVIGRYRSGAAGHCAVGAIGRLHSSRRFLDHVRAIEALRVPGDHRVEAVYPECPRFPSDRASLKVLTYEGSFLSP
jgi:hypothetical protein